MSRRADVGAIERDIIESFTHRYGQTPAVVTRSPGRVNLIGDHTDYNLGLSLPMAIEQAVYLAAAPRDDRRVNLHSEIDGSDAAFDIDSDERLSSWAIYPQGVVRDFEARFPGSSGWDGLLATDLPVGAGLSSSAAFEMAIARVCAYFSGVPWHPLDMAKVGWRAENEWVGMESGLLDQISSAAATAGHLMLIDFSSLEVEQIPFPTRAEVLVIDSSQRRQLTSTAYNDRRRESDEAAHVLGVTSLSEVTHDHLAESSLPDPLRRRARHVVTENALVRDVVDCFLRGDLVGAGEALTASHRSLRDDYESSTEVVDALAELAQRADGCFGARITGGGFGGSVVALVEPGASDAIAADVLPRFNEATGLSPTAVVATPQAGTSIVFRAD